MHEKKAPCGDGNYSVRNPGQFSRVAAKPMSPSILRATFGEIVLPPRRAWVSSEAVHPTFPASACRVKRCSIAARTRGSEERARLCARREATSIVLMPLVVTDRSRPVNPLMAARAFSYRLISTSMRARSARSLLSSSASAAATSGDTLACYRSQHPRLFTARPNSVPGTGRDGRGIGGECPLLPHPSPPCSPIPPLAGLGAAEASRIRIGDASPAGAGP